MTKVLVVFGTRPEAIKMAPVVKRLRQEPSIETLVCVTGQHRQMLDQVLNLFNIKPDHDFNLMKPSQTLSGITTGVLEHMDALLQASRPDRVLVHGDTTTAMAAALACFHRQVPVGHVEAGLRTWDMSRPWPEEMNRCVVDLVADLLFAPTEMSRRNLEAANTQGKRIVVTGNTVIDALLMVVDQIRSNPGLEAELAARFPMLAAGRKLVLVTGHRRENFGDGFESICKALHTLSEREDVEIVYPVHLNPNVREPVGRILGGCGRVHLIEPLDYLPFVYLMTRAYLILTDSGGIQEEAPSLGKPVLVMRDVTERPEAVEAGTVHLVGTDVDSITETAFHFLENPEAYRQATLRANPYGDGLASDRIVKEIAR